MLGDVERRKREARGFTTGDAFMQMTRRPNWIAMLHYWKPYAKATGATMHFWRRVANAGHTLTDVVSTRLEGKKTEPSADLDDPRQ